MAFCFQKLGVRRQVPTESTTASSLPHAPALLSCVSSAATDFFPRPSSTNVVIIQGPKALAQCFPIPVSNVRFLREPESLPVLFATIQALEPRLTSFITFLFGALPLKLLFVTVLESWLRLTFSRKVKELSVQPAASYLPVEVCPSLAREPITCACF